MMGAIRWARWSITRLLFLGILGFLFATGASQHPWILDADYAGRTITTTSLSMCPLLAAATAYDVNSRLGATLAELSRGTVRGRLSTALPVVVATFWCLAAVVIAYVTAVVVVQLNGGVPPRDFWLLPEVAFALLASAAVGAACGFCFQGFLAAPVAAGIVLLSAVIGASVGATPFQVASNYGTMIGVERTPARALISMALHIAIVALSFTVIRRSEWPLVSQKRMTLGLGGLPLVIVLAVAVLVPIHDSEYRPTREATSCFTASDATLGAAQVCGPQRAHVLLVAAAGDLDASLNKLSPSGLGLPHTFAIARGEAVKDLGTSRTSLELYDPSKLKNGHLPEELIAATLATPRACAALFSDVNPGEILDPQAVVHDWILRTLSSPTPVTAAPAAVRAAYTTVSTCPLVDTGT